MLRATDSFFVGTRLVAKGDIVDPSDPIVAGRVELFETITPTRAVVEQATAAPGEKRSVRKAPAKKAAAKPAED